MPRAGQTATALGARLPQRVVLGLLIRAFPPPRVDQILDTLGRREQRQRLLPARLMVYFTLGMWIFGSLSYEEVLAEILRGVPGLTNPGGTPQSGQGPNATATAAAIGRARRRLGVEPLRLLFEEVAGPATAIAPDPLLPGCRRTLRLDSVAIDVPDTLANRIEFGGRVRDSAPGPAFPKVRLALLIDDRAHRVVAAGLEESPDRPPLRQLAAAIAPGTLLVMGERAFSPGLWGAVADLGCDQLWNAQDAAELPVHLRLPDGSRISRLPGADGSARRTVRVVSRPGHGLITSILDYRAAPAERLLAVYDRYRTTGLGFEGITVYQGGDRLVLRSKSPDLVRQELYAMLCVHHTIGELVDYTLLDKFTQPQNSL
jgi:Insertion element 4 transposase N-terminal